MSFSIAMLPAQVKQQLSSELNYSLLPSRTRSRRKHYVSPTARLFGPAIFEASKLKVLFLGVKEKKHYLPRTYTLTHSDITSQITLAIAHTVNIAQIKGWYSRLQRGEVVAEWKKVKGETSLHVHCHISGGHFFLDYIAGLRYCIFAMELPVVLKAFTHGDSSLFQQYPELEEAPVWVYFQSNLPEFNRVEYWERSATLQVELNRGCCQRDVMATVIAVFHPLVATSGHKLCRRSRILRAIGVTRL